MRLKRLLAVVVLLGSLGIGVTPASAASPNVTSFNPTSGMVGDSVVLTGDGFDTATAVSFNGTAQPAFTIDLPTQITTTVPSGATTGKISVVNTDGTGDSLTDFTVLPTPTPPTVSSFAPAKGIVGTSVSITGTNLDDVTDVTFDGVAATFTAGPTEISAEVPAGAHDGVISVTSPDGSDDSSTPFLVIRRPRITGFSPQKGPVGTIVTIVGNDQLRWVNRVWFGSVRAQFTIATHSKLKAKVPEGFVDAKIKVRNPAGLDTSKDVFQQRRIHRTTHITFALAGSLRARGSVTAEDREHVCEARRVVLIQQLIKGEWRAIKRTRTSRRGGYSTSIPDVPGSYRAVARFKTTLTVLCLPAESTAEKH